MGLMQTLTHAHTHLCAYLSVTLDTCTFTHVYMYEQVKIWCVMASNFNPLTSGITEKCVFDLDMLTKCSPVVMHTDGHNCTTLYSMWFNCEYTVVHLNTCSL